METDERATSAVARNRWAVLAVAVAAQTATSMFQFGLAFLVPELRMATDVSLTVAAFLIACPSIGLMLTLLLWGVVADRLGDRFTMTLGLTGTCVMLALSTVLQSVLALAVVLIFAGGFASSVNVTSGRAVLGSFGAHQRGLAMGIRQTAPLLGMLTAALAFPLLAHSYSFAAALLFSSACCGVCAAFAAVILDSRRPVKSRARGVRISSPYTSYLWRIHGASALLVVPQIAVYSFAFVFLVETQKVPSNLASASVAVSLVFGAILRLSSGAWSDRLGNRLLPMRALAIASTASVTVTAYLIWLRSPAGAVALLAAVAISASWNGLAFTAVAERAGMSWAGRALGVQNTVQYVATAATPPVTALLVTWGGYPTAFMVAAIAGLLGAVIIPGRERQQVDPPECDLAD